MEIEWSIVRELQAAGLVAGRPGVGRELESALRTTIRSGRLAAGARLPSTRELAAQLGVSRGTVTSAYDQLAAEGLLSGRAGAGTTVVFSRDVTPHDVGAARPDSTGSSPAVWLDLHTGRPDLSRFPRTTWVRATRQAMAELPESDLGYGDARGLAALRTTLLSYSRRVRGVDATVDSVVVVSGVAQGLGLAGRALRAAGHTSIAVEDPGHPGSVAGLAAAGLRTLPVPVDAGGLRVSELARQRTRAVLVTPAHQSPLGVALAPERRRDLLAWAAEVDGVILEDDYDAEHRYDRSAVGAVQPLAPDRVVHLSSLSKTLAPAVRLGWVIVPERLRQEYVAAKWIDDLGTSPLLQATVAALVAGGGYERHLRAMRAIYRRRRDALVAELATQLPEWTLTGIAAGLHAVVRLPDGLDPVVVAARLADRGIGVPTLVDFYHSVFGGELSAQTFGDFGASEDPSERDKIMHSQLVTETGMVLMAADTPAEMDYTPGFNQFSVSLSGDDETRLRRYWDQLSADGTVTMPLEKAPWGDLFGMCTDKYGVSWMVNVTAQSA